MCDNHEIDLMLRDAFHQQLRVGAWRKPDNFSFRIVVDGGNVSGHDDDILIGVVTNPLSGPSVGRFARRGVRIEVGAPLVELHLQPEEEKAGRKHNA